MEVKEYKDQLEPLALQDPKGLQELTVQMDQLEAKDQRVILDPKAM